MASAAWIAAWPMASRNTGVMPGAGAIDYEGAGTVEFLLDSDTSFYFMEMNTRLQVEHPVTEMISGQDLVEWQLRVADGEPLPLAQEQLAINGHAFEARIYAEDPDNDFLPVTGTLAFVQPPETSPHVRVDTGVRQGDEVSVFYDPMIAKLIVWDEDRDRALGRLTRALSEYRISGTTTNIDFLYNLASSQPFRDADLDTGFIDKHHAAIFHDSVRDIESDLPLAALYLLLRQNEKAAQAYTHAGGNGPQDVTSPWHLNNAWRSVEDNIHTLNIVLHEAQYQLEVEQKQFGTTTRYTINHNGHTVAAQGTLQGSVLRAELDGYQFNATVAEHDDSFSLYTADSAITFRQAEPDLGDADQQDAAGGLIAPMNGTMVALLVEVDASVSKGDPLLVMEAMKMEHTIRAPADGHVVSFFYQAGELVDGGAQLLEFSTRE